MRMALSQVSFHQRFPDYVLRIEVEFRIGTKVIQKSTAMRTDREEFVKRTIQDLLESLIYEWNAAGYADEQMKDFEIDVLS